MMPAPKWTQEDYDRAAAEYQRKLPPEHYMEASLSGVQRAITLASLMVIRGLTSGFHVFNELLVQFFCRGQIVQVVPDNMVVRGDLDDRQRTSYAADVEPVPFWVLEYVSRSSERKDYVENWRIYEEDLRVPYYLIFHPERKDLTLLRRVGGQYVSVEPNVHGRLGIDEIGLEVGLLGGWARFWFRGELIDLPDELYRQLGIERHLRVSTERALRHRDEEIARREQEREEMVRAHSEELRKRDEQIQQQQRVARERDELLQQQQREARERDELLQQQQRETRERNEAMAASLRPFVEAKARQAGRDDILTELPAVADPARLTAWLVELR